MNSVVHTYFTDGKIEGKKEQAIETAITLLKNNVDLTIISTSTGLSMEELEKLKSEL
ncbi:hypothetical protein ACE193_11385 [Bernardetia sp. OM2101]|uniref:hypothetical protein n=1 Tax=Bernardetia sp. OM2101 TaxID=3344876 RepID=UPI0035CF6C27